VDAPPECPNYLRVFFDGDGCRQTKKHGDRIKGKSKDARTNKNMERSLPPEQNMELENKPSPPLLHKARNDLGVTTLVDPRS